MGPVRLMSFAGVRVAFRSVLSCKFSVTSTLGFE